jgi:hypothetical protein
MVRLYFCLLAALFAAAVIILLANVAVGDHLVSSLAGDVVFVLALGVLIWRNTAIPLMAAGSVLTAVAAFIATGILLADLGGATYFSVPSLGHILVHIFSVGYYPSGADVPFDMGALLWGFSMLGLCTLGLALGGLVRTVANRERSPIERE